MSQSLDYFKRLEIGGRRVGATHPDQCPKLRLHGVDFAIPPRGIQVRPRFDSDGKATLEMSGADESQLKVTGSSGVEAVLRASSSTVTVGSNTNHNLYLRTNNTAQVTVTNAGNA